MVEWIISNKEWIFSGLGIAIISAFFAILKTKTPTGGEGNLNVSGDKNVIGDGNILQITNLTEEKQQSNIKIVDISLNEDKEFIVDIKLRNIGDQVAYIKEIKLWRWYDEQRRKEMCPVSESKYRNAGRRI